MRRSSHRTIVLLFLFILFLPLNVVHAENHPEISNVSTTYEFGSTLQISANLQNGDSLSELFIIIQPDGLTSRQIKIIPQNNVVSIRYDLKKNPFAPFSRVYFWFQGTRSDGSSYQSPSFWFDYLDDRFQWKTSVSKLFEVHWVTGEVTFGQKIQDIARIGLERSTQILPVAPVLPIQIYVYPDGATLQEALNLTGQQWAAGHTAPKTRVVMVSQARSQGNLSDLERQIPHELMHILQYQVTGSGYGNAPAWLLEGLATSVEINPDPELERVLNQAVKDGSLILLADLCSSFPASRDGSLLAYAESVSFVQYILAHFDTSITKDILTSAANGSSCSLSVQSATGLSLSELEQNWLKADFPESMKSPLQRYWWIALLSALALAAAIYLLIREFRNSQGVSPNE